MVPHHARHREQIEAEVTMRLTVNTQTHDILPPWQDDTLLWVLREALALTGTKYGCGQGQCGACTVLIDGEPQRACMVPVRAVGARPVTTVEGLAPAPDRLHRLQAAWIAEAVPQCGYCQAGLIMAAAALLAANPRPDAAAIDAAMAGHLCRCGTQTRVRRAIQRAGAVPQA